MCNALWSLIPDNKAEYYLLSKSIGRQYTLYVGKMFKNTKTSRVDKSLLYWSSKFQAIVRVRRTEKQKYESTSTDKSMKTSQVILPFGTFHARNTTCMMRQKKQNKMCVSQHIMAKQLVHACNIVRQLIKYI